MESLDKDREYTVTLTGAEMVRLYRAGLAAQRRAADGWGGLALLSALGKLWRARYAVDSGTQERSS